MNENYYINLLEKYLCGEGTPQEKDELQSYLISNNRIDSFFEESIIPPVSHIPGVCP